MKLLWLTIFLLEERLMLLIGLVYYLKFQFKQLKQYYLNMLFHSGHAHFELIHHDIVNSLYIEVDEIYHLGKHLQT